MRSLPHGPSFHKTEVQFLFRHALQVPAPHHARKMGSSRHVYDEFKPFTHILNSLLPTWVPKLSFLSTSIKTFHGFRLVPFLPPAAIFPPLSFARLKWQWSFCFWSEDRAALSAFQPLEVLPASMDRNRRACPCSTFPLMKRLTVLPNSNSEKTNRIYS